jgi:hypothetical protein
VAQAWLPQACTAACSAGGAQRLSCGASWSTARHMYALLLLLLLLLLNPSKLF